MQTLTHIGALRSSVATWREQRKSVALVPTMGNLHRGHLALVEQAKRLADRIVVTLFVNPTQFVAGEDFERYPRTLNQDRLLLSETGTDLLFTPEVKEIYPEGLNQHTRVEVPALDNFLCGVFRPGHFTGVATVVTKLFNLVQPDLAIFGEKDYQQILVIKRLVRDLCIPVDIRSVPTVREPNGLALSSRNHYLSAQEKNVAPALYKTLAWAKEDILQGETHFARIERDAVESLANIGFRLEYFSIRRASDLAAPSEEDSHLVILAAAWLGQTRLIDNIFAVRKTR
jgi:pantoate--beta-alanine ligase